MVRPFFDGDDEPEQQVPPAAAPASAATPAADAPVAPLHVTLQGRAPALPAAGEAPAVPGGRDPKSGRFVKGWKGGGRPPRPTLRKLVEERIAAGSTAVDDILHGVFQSLANAARAGDVSAAKILLDHLVEREQQHAASLSLKVITNADGIANAGEGDGYE